MAEESAWMAMEELLKGSIHYCGGVSNCGEGAGNLLRHYGKGTIAVWANAHYYVFPPGHDENTPAENLGNKIVGGKIRDDITVVEPCTLKELRQIGFTDKTDFVLQRTSTGKWKDEAF